MSRVTPSCTGTSPPAQRSSGLHGIARTLSKFGLCSRTQAIAFVLAGRVAVNGRVVDDPETPVDAASDRIELDGAPAVEATRIYVMLNKPRGIVTSARDEQGRATVYSLLEESDLPWIAPVGRLDKASEGLLLLTNDTAWSARIAAPETNLDKTYHVQIDRLPDAAFFAALHQGIEESGEHLAVKSARELRRGERNAWLEVVLDEGRNRQIRRLLKSLDTNVIRLIRVAIGPLTLGNLAKGKWRLLEAAEKDRLAR